MNVLITGGGCREPIDGVRCVTNMSTGRTAAQIADRFAAAGAQVTALLAVQSQLPESAPLQENTRQPETGRSGSPLLRLFRYETGAELAALMEKELTSGAYDAVIHAAAVSDFRPAVITVNGESYPAGKNAGKIPSGSRLSVTFEPAPKIAVRLRTWAAAGNPGGKMTIVCFKLTDGADSTERLRAAAVLFGEDTADYVVSNDLSEMKDSGHKFALLGRSSADGELPVTIRTGTTTEELAESLLMLIRQQYCACAKNSGTAGPA
ncbi:MAG TPA: hypothetical protein DCL73_01265 [Treponema sp.]|nr:hypothetical protein [Treponema sp.]